MAIVIKYTLCTKVNRGTESEPKWVESLTHCEIACATQAQYDVNLPIVLAEAYNGEYTESGEFEEETKEQTQEERIAELEEALDMLLSGVTE